MNCFDAVSRDRNGGSVNAPPPGSLKDQHIRLSWRPAAGFLFSSENSHTSSQNREAEDTCGLPSFSPQWASAAAVGRVDLWLIPALLAQRVRRCHPVPSPARRQPQSALI